jgi:G3E family GTPase
MLGSAFTRRASLSGKRPVSVLGGFLGSGKTTLLRRALSDGPVKDVAVVINEFGEVGLDHHLVRQAGEQTVLLAGGCVCCNRREDLVRVLKDFLDQDECGEIPKLRRVVIETSGLADPAPVLFTIVTDPVLQHHFQVDRIVVTVDALNGQLQLDRQPESLKQAAVADDLVITKVDAAEPEQTLRLVRRLRSLNPAARITESSFGEGAADIVLGDHDHARLPAATSEAISLESGHALDSRSISLSFDHPLDWVAFSLWLSLLLHAHGEDILRVKGLLDIEEVGLVAINGVQHLIHPPEHLEERPEGVQSSRLVLITRGDATLIERSLHAFQKAGRGAGLDVAVDN